MTPKLTKGPGVRPGGATKGPGKSGLDAELIRELAALLEETGLGEIEVEHEGVRLRVARPVAIAAHGARPPGVGMAMAPDPGAPVKEKALPPEAPHPGTVTSPMVGTVYVAPQPGAPPFVKLGDEVKEGQTLLIIEAMKTMNPIPAPRAGKIIEIHMRDAQPVEFGEPLLVIA